MTTVLQQIRQQSSGGSSIGFTGASGVHVDTNGTEVFVLVASQRSTPRTVTGITGLGATWAEVHNSGTSRFVVWKGTGANVVGSPGSPATVTVTFSGTQSAAGQLLVVTGLTGTTVVGSFTSQPVAGTIVGPSASADTGQLVADVLAGGATAWPSAETPSGGWVLASVATGLSGSFAAYRLPASSQTHQLEATTSGLSNYLGQAVIGDVAGGVPDEPENLVVTPSADGTELTLDWDAPSAGFAPDGYDVRIDGGAATDVGNVLTHDFTGLTPDTGYTLEVRAYNAFGDSSWVSIGGTTTAPPDTPTNLVATPGPTSVTLTWDASTGSPDGYEVMLDNGTPVDIGNVLTYEFEDLYPGADYLLEVRAYNEAGFSAWASLSSETPTPTESEYTAEITLGHLTWTITSGECEFGDIVVLDGLTIGWQADESRPWPTQPDAVSCQLGLYVADVVDMADIAIGTPLSVVLTDVVDNVFATFHGRVSQMTAQAKANGPVGLYMLYTLAAVDYTVDLAELPITISEEWPAESADDRFTRIVDAIGALPGTNIVLSPPADTGTAAFEALAAGTTDALTLVMSHLDQIAVEGDGGVQRYILVPIVTGGELGAFECVPLDRTVDGGLLPGVFDVVDGELVLTFPDLDADGVVDACAVDLGATWTRLKYRAVNHVTVAGPVTAEAFRTGPPVRLNLTTTLTDQAAAQRMAELYLPDMDESIGWVADTFRLYAYKEPAAIVPAWFPDHRTDPAVTSVYVMPLALVGVAAPINLAGSGEVYAGQLVKVTLQISESRVYVDFGLRRQLPHSSGVGALTWDDVSANWPTVTWDDVSPGLSWYDALLGKAP